MEFQVLRDRFKMVREMVPPAHLDVAVGLKETTTKGFWSPLFEMLRLAREVKEAFKVSGRWKF